MKTNVLKMSALSLCGALALTACSNDETTTPVEQQNQVSPELLQKINSVGLTEARDVKYTDFVLPDGSTIERIKLDDDIIMDEDAIWALQTFDDIVTQEKQYRTNNLVTGSNRNIDIIGYTGGGGFGLTNTQRTAIQWAVNNYNRLGGVTLNFNLTFGTNFQPQDIVVYRNPNNNGTGGSAGFPSNGRPNKFVQLYTGMDGLSTNANEHVITHEIGHSVGFRHSDYFSRQSCGQNTNEGSAGVGAIYVNGTATGWDPSSLMNACFSTSTNGEFNGNDVRALQNMY